MTTRYVFVHGLGGWGSYDRIDRFIPEWGMLGGSLIKYLNRQGYACYAASVAPDGSAWDRACELYAQLAGAVTDYGAAHAAKAGHARFGRDFSAEPLIPDWNGGRPRRADRALLRRSDGAAALGAAGKRRRGRARGSRRCFAALSRRTGQTRARYRDARRADERHHGL